MESEIRDAASAVRKAKNILVVSHIDADGIASAAITASTCERLGKEYEVVFAPKLSEEYIDRINNSDSDLVWVCDLGSGYLSEFTKDPMVITDHHVPDPKWRKGQTYLDDFNEVHHINPHCYGMEGSTEACGATMTYLLSKELDGANTDLACLAVVGACGDVQDTSDEGLVGLNTEPLWDAVDRGDMEVETDLRMFGKETRTLTQFLQYSDPRIPGLGDEPAECARFLESMKVDLKDGGRAKSWNDLTAEEKERVREGILSRLSIEDRNRALGPSYRLVRYPRHSELRDAKEYTTLLNSCGRYDDAETGMRICMGDTAAVEKAKKNRMEHRRNISAALALVKENNMVHMRRSIMYFDAGDRIRDTVVGIVAGMILNTEGFRRDMPIIAFADSDDGIKVSARADRSLVRKGLDLASIMKIASEMVGGYGGGHNIAAGATIPRGKEEVFLDAVDDMVLAQLI